MNELQIGELLTSPIALVGGCIGSLVFLLLVACWMLRLSWKRNIQDVLRESIAILANAKHEYTDQVKELENRVEQAIAKAKAVPEESKAKLADALVSWATEVHSATGNCNKLFRKQADEFEALIKKFDEVSEETSKKQVDKFENMMKKFDDVAEETRKKTTAQIKQAVVDECTNQKVSEVIDATINKFIIDAQPKLDAAIVRVTRKPLPTYKIEYKHLEGFDNTSFRAVLTDTDGYRSECLFTTKERSSTAINDLLIADWKKHLQFRGVI